MTVKELFEKEDIDTIVNTFADKIYSHDGYTTNGGSFVGPLYNPDVLYDASDCLEECKYLEQGRYYEDAWMNGMCYWYPDECDPMTVNEFMIPSMTCPYGICRKEVYKKRLREWLETEVK